MAIVMLDGGLRYEMPGFVSRQPCVGARGRQGIVKCVKAKGIPVLVYEPTMEDEEFFGPEVTHDLDGFKRRADVIVANRWSDELADVGEKVYTRNLFRRD